MRLLIVLIVLLFAVLGVLFGALNADWVVYDLLFAHVRVPKGAALLAMLVLGWILGGLLVWLGVVQPLRYRLRRVQRQQDRRTQAVAESSGLPDRT